MLLSNSESTYPTILLGTTVEVVPAVTADSVKVERVIEDMNERTVTVAYLIPGEQFPRTCDVLTSETYFPEWDDITVANAIRQNLGLSVTE